jgi:hypothetical protein
VGVSALATVVNDDAGCLAVFREQACCHRQSGGRFERNLAAPLPVLWLNARAGDAGIFQECGR